MGALLDLLREAEKAGYELVSEEVTYDVDWDNPDPATRNFTPIEHRVVFQKNLREA